MRPGWTGLRSGSQKCEVIFDVENRRRRLSELENQSSQPGFWDDANKAREIMDQAAREREILEPYDRLVKSAADAAFMLEMASTEPEEERASILLEAQKELEGLDRLSGDMEMRSLLSGPLDSHNAFLSLHAGAGGTESCDWAAMLLRMYRRWCETRGFEAEVMDVQPGEEAGIKSATLLISGPFAYGYLKAERGVHRLVRISPFDSNKRRHTSFASADVIAEVDDDIDIVIDEAQLRVDTYRSSGAGGQHVNKTDSAIRITHLPTGIVVSCQTQRSQHKNRSQAMKMLKAKLYELEMDRKRKEMDRFYGEKGEIAWGNQIRSYVLQPYTLVKDHRTEVETSNVESVLDGGIDLFVEGYLKSRAR